MASISIILLIIGAVMVFGAPFTRIGMDYPNETVASMLIGTLIFMFGMIYWYGGY